MRERESDDNKIVPSIEELADDQEIIFHDSQLGLNIPTDAGFIKRLAEVLKEHQRTVELIMVGGVVVALVVTVVKRKTTRNGI